MPFWTFNVTLKSTVLSTTQISKWTFLPKINETSGLYKDINFYQSIGLVLSILKESLLSVVHYNGHKIRTVSFKSTSKAKIITIIINLLTYQAYKKRMYSIQSSKCWFPKVRR